MPEYDFEISENDECKTRNELLGSLGFQRFLYLYNREMSKTDPRHEDLTPADAAHSYNDARRLFEYWKKLQMTGNVTAITNIQKLIESSLEDVRSRDTGRVLSRDEVVERCDRSGIDIENSVKESEELYRSLGYEESLRKNGQLGEAEEYKLEIPTLSEARMQKLEKLFDHDFGAVVMVDDRRLNTKELVDLLFKNPRRVLGRGYDLIQESTSLTDSELEEVVREYIKYHAAQESSKIASYALGKSRQGVKGKNAGISREAGLMVFSPYEAPPILPPMEHMPGESFMDAAVKNRHPMDLSAYLKSMAFIKKTSPDLAKRMIINDKGSAMYTLSTILNNVLPNGEILVVEDLPGLYMSIKSVQPAAYVNGAVCRECYYV